MRLNALHARTARALVRAVLVVCLGAGAGLLAWGLMPAPEAPLPAQSFDVRTSRSGASPGGSRAGSSAAAARPAPVRAPVGLRIPSLGVEAPLERESVSGDGGLVIPGDPSVVGWWHGGTTKDGLAPEVGTLVLAGHVDSNGDLGALHPLSGIAAGAEIVTLDAAGRQERWRVDALEVRDKDDLPALPATGARRLAVVTCGGPVIQTSQGRTYRDNVIAWASPA